jgi:hypothetical protein
LRPTGIAITESRPLCKQERICGIHDWKQSEDAVGRPAGNRKQASIPEPGSASTEEAWSHLSVFSTPPPAGKPNPTDRYGGKIDDSIAPRDRPTGIIDD